MDQKTKIHSELRKNESDIREKFENWADTVSYTHLDVYKRQISPLWRALELQKIMSPSFRWKD